MMIKEEIKEDHSNSVAVVKLFLENMDILKPEQRERMIQILEYLILPRYVAEGRPQIEEEWINKQKKEDERTNTNRA